MDSDIILVGAFGEMVELAALCGKKVIGIIENNLKGCFRDIPIIGTDFDAPSLLDRFSSIPIVVSPDKPQVRKKLVEYYRLIGFSFSELISPDASISSSAKIGEGTVIQSHCNVSSDVIIGDFCKLNTFANLMHNNSIGDYVTIAPNAVLLGYAEVSECAYIGASSTVLPGRRVGVDAIVGAGAVVTKNVSNGVIVKGVPANEGGGE